MNSNFGPNNNDFLEKTISASKSSSNTNVQNDAVDDIYNQLAAVPNVSSVTIYTKSGEKLRAGLFDSAQLIELSTLVNESAQLLSIIDSCTSTSTTTGRNTGSANNIGNISSFICTTTNPKSNVSKNNNSHGIANASNIINTNNGNNGFYISNSSSSNSNSNSNLNIGTNNGDKFEESSSQAINKGNDTHNGNTGSLASISVRDDSNPKSKATTSSRTHYLDKVTLDLTGFSIITGLQNDLLFTITLNH
ncbi:hypothetical protein AX774_g5070 [Zancudomyces culisetae]|uniref:Uncharacterized protein n=1 Tax=Zancudomyces culisetae TaxID=1213189 RepID=A0A1R1PKI6_ZANCU|nr:hypothetical protein AX774_g5070 [Zancudomyces culisetae]|eukprot:OMH81475.1 hypothetical protein AX774_g5070 [Zancudomyces culisetae]